MGPHTHAADRMTGREQSASCSRYGPWRSLIVPARQGVPPSGPGRGAGRGNPGKVGTGVTAAGQAPGVEPAGVPGEAVPYPRGPGAVRVFAGGIDGVGGVDVV